MRVGKQAFAMDRERHTATGPDHQRLLDGLLKFLYLLAQRRLRSTDVFRSATHDGRIGNGDKIPQQKWLHMPIVSAAAPGRAGARCQAARLMLVRKPVIG